MFFLCLFIFALVTDEAATNTYKESENHLAFERRTVKSSLDEKERKKSSELEAEREKRHCEEMKREEQRRQIETDFQNELRKIMETEKVSHSAIPLLNVITYLFC